MYGENSCISASVGCLNQWFPTFSLVSHLVFLVTTGDEGSKINIKGDVFLFLDFQKGKIIQ